MPRLKLILNPQADRGHAAEAGPDLRAILAEEAEAASRQQGRDYELVWALTGEPRHATALAREAAEEGIDVVVAIGGDGTIHEVVNGLMAVEAARRPRLGVIPVGSGNDFASNFGVPDDLRAAARCLLGDTSYPTDVGWIADGTGRGEYWCNTVGVGFTGAVNIATRRLKRWRGFMSYFIGVLQTILFTPPSLEAQITVGEDPAFERGITMVAICNGPREGGGFPVAPGAEMDDGLLDYVIMRKMGRLRIARFLPVVMQARHLKHPKHFEAGKIARLHITADRTMAVHTDGEVFGPWEADIRELTIRVEPHAVEVMGNCARHGEALSTPSGPNRV
jgi:diacylglycerol kinase (ATP)